MVSVFRSKGTQKATQNWASDMMGSPLPIGLTVSGRILIDGWNPQQAVHPLPIISCQSAAFPTLLNQGLDANWIVEGLGSELRSEHLTQVAGPSLADKLYQF